MRDVLVLDRKTYVNLGGAAGFLIKMVAKLNLFAIRESDGSYYFIKNRYTLQRFVNTEQEFKKLLEYGYMYDDVFEASYKAAEALGPEAMKKLSWFGRRDDL